MTFRGEMLRRDLSINEIKKILTTRGFYKAPIDLKIISKIE